MSRIEFLFDVLLNVVLILSIMGLCTLGVTVFFLIAESHGWLAALAGGAALIWLAVDMTLSEGREWDE